MMNLGGTIKLNRKGWALVFGVLALILLVHFGWQADRNDQVERPKPAAEESRAKVTAKSLLAAGVRAAVAGGAAVKDVTDKGNTGARTKGKTDEGVDEPVTDADYNSHCRMLAVLEEALPSIRIISEESIENKKCPTTIKADIELSDEDAMSDLNDELVNPDDVTIWIDPLDATKEFTEKLYHYVTTMVCIAVKGFPIAGVIHKPFEDETSWAWSTKGISKNLKLPSKMENSNRSPIVIVSLSHKGKVENFTSRAFGSKHKIVSAGGAGYKVLEVVHNKADVYIHTTKIKKWDICAGNAILSALGGKMTTLQNKPIDYSYDSDKANNDGVLAAVWDHDLYAEKVKEIKL